MRGAFIGLLLVGVALGGCHAMSSSGGGDGGHRGRYAGVGLYSADRGWAHVAGAPEPADKAVATTADDTTLIVTVDGATGEIRQCGNYSGHCVAMNPWRGALGAKQAAPVSLTGREDTTVANTATTDESDANEATPAKR
ncbi:MAG: hypothetical protein JWL96_2979 [Sphingomonas bacterium]|uniref:hypothetical protein n=1 Tax=Sphingomonas bacterium TaxID=1895847 RepID=UPI002605B9BA|nr:hypothetical protein [Sphingomonas bacterium]MDB5710909.1 hypothetical protein [Sphingomonas bacterium]